MLVCILKKFLYLYWVNVMSYGYQHSSLLLDESGNVVYTVFHGNDLLYSWELTAFCLSLGKVAQSLAFLSLRFRTILVKKLEQLRN